MHVVLVQVKVHGRMLDEFERAILHNARESVAKDPGCLRFDVCQVHDDPTRWILFEVYTDRAAHAAHRESPHFIAYNAVAERAITEKSVVWAVDRHLGR